MVDVSKSPFLDQAPRQPNCRDKSVVERNHVFHSVPLDFLEHLPGTGGCQRKRFLTEDVLPNARGCHSDLFVLPARSTDVYQVHVVPLQQDAPVRLDILPPELARHLLRFALAATADGRELWNYIVVEEACSGCVGLAMRPTHFSVADESYTQRAQEPIIPSSHRLSCPR